MILDDLIGKDGIVRRKTINDYLQVEYRLIDTSNYDDNKWRHSYSHPYTSIEYSSIDNL